MAVSKVYANQARHIGLVDQSVVKAAWSGGMDIDELEPLKLVADQVEPADVTYLMRHSMTPSKVLALLARGASFAQIVQIHASGEILGWAESLLEAGLPPDGVVTVARSGYGLLPALHLSRVEPPLTAEQIVEVLSWEVYGRDAAEFLSAGGTLEQLKAFCARGLDMADVAYAWQVVTPELSTATKETFAVLASGALAEDRIRQVPASSSARVADLLEAAVALSRPSRTVARPKASDPRSVV